MAEPLKSITVEVSMHPNVKQLIAEHAALTAELTELAVSSGSDHTAAKYWKQRQDARNELCTVKDERDAAKWERDAALAVIEQVRALRDEMFAANDSPEHEVPLDLVIDRLDPILAQPPTSALAKVKADAWDEGHAQTLANIAWPKERKSNPYREETT